MPKKYFNKNAFQHIILYTLFFAIIGCKIKQNKNTVQENNKLLNHSYSNYPQITIKHINLAMDISFKKRQINGKIDLKYDNNSSTNVLILDTKALKIDSVHDNFGKNLTYTMGKNDSILGASLSINLEKNTEYVSIFYQTTEKSESLQGLNPEQNYAKKHPFLFTQSQAILARSWIPLQDCPAVRFTYDATITLDEDLLPLMSASNPQKKNTERTYHFHMPQAIPSYLMALCVGDLDFVALGDSCGVYAEPAQINACAKEFEDLQSMIDSASNLYGPYQWGRYDVVVLPPSFPFGGMENPRLTFATPTIIAGDKSLVALIAHELAHSWSGNLVTNHTWNDFWLNEGFTVYFENRIMEKIYGKKYADMLVVLGMGELKTTLADLKDNLDDTHLYLNLDGRNPDDGVTDIAYEKGRFFLLLIEQTVGRENFDAFLNNYFAKYAFKTVTTAQFINELNSQLLDKNSEWKENINYKEWIYGPSLPANCPNPQSTELLKVEKDAKDYLQNKTLPNISTYSTHHWLHFLRNLPDNLSLEHIAQLDEAFSLSKTQNAEIACDWFKHAINSKYTIAYPAMEQFLMTVGRRKFLTPLYSRMIETPEGKKMAMDIFDKAKSSYHAVSYNTINDLIN